MAFVADHDDLASLLAHARDFRVHLGHEGAGGIEHAQPARVGLAANREGHAVGGKDDGAARRNVRQFLDEDGALRAKVLHHELVVDDLVTHVDGRAVHLERALDDGDRAVDARAESARLCQDDFDGFGHGPFLG